MLLGLPLDLFAQDPDSTRRTSGDTISNRPYTPSRRPTYQPADRYGDPFSNTTTQSPLYLKDPSRMDVQIDTSGNYTIYEKMGDVNYRPTSSMSLQEFKQYQDRQLLREYWKTRSRAQDGESAVSARSVNPKIFISPILDRIFGGSYVELIPRGFVTLDFGGTFQRINSPSIPIRQQRNGGFEFNQQINMSVVGKVGEKLAITANFDNNNSFDFQNNMKVEYTGFKEDILQKLEIGNVSLPLNNTLIQGSQNLFGIKAQLQFGKLNVTTIATTQRGKTSSIDINGGGPGGNAAQGRPFEIIASGYDENRHFFLGHFFRENYQAWVKNSPQIISGVNVTQIEVYVLNRATETQTLRNVVAFMDLAEGETIYNGNINSNSTGPNDNAANDLFAYLTGNPSFRGDGLDAALNAKGLVNGLDYEKINGARKLAPTEYTIHPQLGYITLNRKLQNDEALAVAYEYASSGGRHKVGELSLDNTGVADDHVIFLKMLRPRKVAVRDSEKRIIPTWLLMMKNIYSLGVNQVAQEGFQLRIIYKDDKTGIDNPQLQEGPSEVRTKQLIEIFGLDRLNPVNDPMPDGNFDFVEGITINAANGLIIFPRLEPFSESLREVFDGNTTLIRKYAYDTLYRTTKAAAELFATQNKFWLKGYYNASGGSAKEIMIPGFGVAPGSVKLYAGNIPLVENVDYVVDYTFGKVTILNDAILSSGKDIQVQYEQNDPFAFQTRSLLGTRFDYKLNEDVNFGSTFLYYNERPLITRNQIGTEPARNIQYGFDFNIHKDSRLLTKMVDAIPLIQTKEQSSVNITGEFAQLLPGTSNVVDGEGTAYVDDFESSATPYSLMNPFSWKLASVPKFGDFSPVSGEIQNDRQIGSRRAKLAWYSVDNQFQRDNGQYRPNNITDKDAENHYVRGVYPQEIFPKRQNQQAVFFEQIFDIAYFPGERGPYNYDYARFNDPIESVRKKNWAGITTAIRTEVDFDKANIEYVEFWLLDPFLPGENGVVLDGRINQRNTTGGKVILQLGSISEDVQRDGKHAFENGLPPNGDYINGPVISNAFGYVTTQNFLTNGFDNTNPGSRKYQDVGLDGAPNSQEQQLFAPVPAKDQADPSADDYRHFFDNSYDRTNAKILERYKDYNGQDGNTPVQTSASTIATASYQNPDNEDLNADNTLSELEEYYEYDIDLEPANLQVNKEYIVDKNYDAAKNVTWYLFRIPVREYESRFGEIDGFKSIRYARLILTDFEKPVVLRMANFRMVGSRWRRYEGTVFDDGIIPFPEGVADNFSVSVVNLEENSEPDEEGNKSGYVIPPGAVRDRDNSSAVSRLLNEQSIQVCIDDLQDGEGRAIYKNMVVDLFNYGRIKMFLHANSEADDDDLTAFVRLGTDFDQNYYEIEIPLKITKDIQSGNSRDVWPEENEIDLDLDELYGLKAARDREGFSLGEPYPLTGPRKIGRHGLRIMGRPDLSSVQVIMIGVRNPKSTDKEMHSVCIWANELRVTDFDKTAGWAVSSTLTAKLADFAVVNGAFRHTSFGFGGVSSKIFERTRDRTTNYDVGANVNLDKLIPGNTGIKIPMFVSYENTLITPEYDPANPDMRIDAMLKSFNLSDPDERKRKNEYLRIIQDRTTRRSLNFMNVRKTKVKPDAPTHIWDIENFSFSYNFSEQIQRNFNTTENLLKNQGGSVNYQFQPKASGIEPFKNSKSLSSPWLKLIKDFNFNLMPTSLQAIFDLDRTFSKRVYRNVDSNGNFVNSDPNYMKSFTFNRNYTLGWDLTKSLSLQYTSRAYAVIDEPVGDIDTKAERDSVISNLKKFGRMKNFNQSATINYKVPLDKIPVLDWVGLDYRYQVMYDWKAGPINIEEQYNFANIIQNSREQDFSGKLDLVKLYNKVKFLKELNTPRKPAPVTKPGSNPKAQAAADTTKSGGSVPGLVKGFAKLMMSVRSINGTYTVSDGTTLPGFNRTPSLFGMDNDWSAPGWNFILGSQDPDFRKEAAAKGWLTTNTLLTTPFSQAHMVNLNIRSNIEPARDLKIQLDMKKETMSSYQEIYRNNDTGGGIQFESLNPSRSGSYRVSVISIKTAFNRSNSDVDSEVHKNFERNLEVIYNRFNKLVEGSPVGYDSAQDVLIPAFIAAYTGQNAQSVSLSPFPKNPAPNWRIDYTGLTQINFFKNLFQSVTISHSYQSIYSITNYTNSLSFDDPDKLSIDRKVEDYNRRYFSPVVDNKRLPIFVINQVLISEQFSPLIGINVRTKSRLTANLQYKTKRDLALNISNAQITELTSKDVSLEIGFTKTNMKLPFKAQGRRIVLKNDLTFRMNTSIGDTRTIQRKIGELDIITNGNINFQLRPNVSYTVNQKLTVQLYFERNVNEPLISNSPPRSTTRFGAQIRFSLAQ
jgi:cell surface protein SprA